MLAFIDIVVLCDETLADDKLRVALLNNPSGEVFSNQMLTIGNGSVSVDTSKE